MKAKLPRRSRGGGKLKIVPHRYQLSFGDIKEENVRGLPRAVPVGKQVGFHLAGMVGHDFSSPTR
jgi:hypothetical protein